jgi:hypothetical protein
MAFFGAKLQAIAGSMSLLGQSSSDGQNITTGWFAQQAPLRPRVEGCSISN